MRRTAHRLIGLALAGLVAACAPHGIPAAASRDAGASVGVTVSGRVQVGEAFTLTARRAVKADIDHIDYKLLTSPGGVQVGSTFTVNKATQTGSIFGVSTTCKFNQVPDGSYRLSAEAFDAGGTSITQGGAATSANIATVSSPNVTYTAGAGGVTTNLTVALRLKDATGETVTAGSGISISDGILYTGSATGRDILPYGTIDALDFKAGDPGDPAAMAGSADGVLYLMDSANQVVNRFDPGTQELTVVAGGGGTDGVLGGIPPQDAKFGSLTALTVDRSGNLYIADKDTFLVHRLDASSGLLTTVAGRYRDDAYNGDNGAGTSIAISAVSAMAADAQGSLYLADPNRNLVWKLATNGQISTFAGSVGAGGNNGDGGPAASATLEPTVGLATAPDGSLLILSNDGTLRRVDGTTGIIATLYIDAAYAAGPPTLIADARGNVLINYQGNQVHLLDYAGRKATQIVGDGSGGNHGDGGPATAAGVSPQALAFDDQGALIILDRNARRLRRVTP